MSIVYSFSLDHCKSQEKMATTFMQNFGGRTDYYGIFEFFWNFLIQFWIYEYNSKSLKLFNRRLVASKGYAVSCLVFFLRIYELEISRQGSRNFELRNSKIRVCKSEFHNAKFWVKNFALRNFRVSQLEISSYETQNFEFRNSKFRVSSLQTQDFEFVNSKWEN